jgi:hypothetical protein
MIFSLKIFFDFSDTLKNKAANHLAAFIWNINKKNGESGGEKNN